MCGIFGIINKDYSKLNKGLFNTLGIINDTRGGDSCGIFIDGDVEYGLNEEKLYYNFFSNSALLNKVENCHLAIGHCRKASVGGVDASKAQPIIIYDDSGIPEFIVIHNGTINNYDDLAKKYIPEINIKGMSDTQVMTQIFYHKGYDVLGEYTGGAVFVIIDYRNTDGHPKVLLWKGVSKNQQHDKVEIDERPFFLVHNDNEFVFSSIPSYLKAFYPGSDVLTIKANTLIELQDNNLYCLETFDRSKCYQTKSYQYNYEGYSYTSSYYITYNSLREFCLNGKRLHGKKFCSNTGSCKDYEDKSANSRWMYFYEGVLLYNEDCLETLVKIQKAFNYKSSSKFLTDYPEIVCLFSVIPVQVAKDSEFYTITDDFMWKPYNGYFYDVMAKYTKVKCINGKLISQTYTAAIEGWDYNIQIMDAYSINKEVLCDQIKANFNVSIQL